MRYTGFVLSLQPVLPVAPTPLRNDPDALRQEAERGDPSAQFDLGVMYSTGHAGAEAPAEAAYWFRLAAEQGHPSSQANLGLMYATGRGVPKQAVQAVRWLRLAAEQGEPTAQVNLGFMYGDGRGVPQDALEAARWYRLAAEQGEPTAQFNLGVACARGRGVPEDLVEAVRWWTLAAEDGVLEAQVNLAHAYAAGRGVPKDAAEGTSWFRVAAQQGHSAAQVMLALRYAFGEGVPQDLVLALMWLTVAAAHGEDVSERRAELEALMTLKEIDQASKLARLCMTSNDPARVVHGWQLHSDPGKTESQLQELARLSAVVETFDPGMNDDDKYDLIRQFADSLDRARAEGRRRGEICPGCAKNVIVSDSLCRNCLLLAAKCAGALLSRWLPRGLWRKCVMFALLGLGFLAPITTWCLIAAWPVAASFSPRLVGEAADFAGSFARAYSEGLRSRR